MLLPFYRQLGELNISPLGLGTVKFGRNTGVKYPTTFALPDDAAIKSLLDVAAELGINVLDTAPAYGISEQRLGQLLSNRRNWIISTKVGETYHDRQSIFDYSAAAVYDSIKASLTRLQTDYLDVVFIHSNGDDLAILHNGETVEALQKLKSQGIIRAIGISGKTVEGGIAALRQYDMDVAMVTYNPLQQNESQVIAAANNLGKGIFVKKAFASGHLSQLGDNPIQASMDFVFASPVSSVVVGTLNPDHLRDNVQAAAGSILANADN